MGHFVDLLLKAVANPPAEEKDVDYVADFNSPRDRILTRDAMAAAKLDQCGVYFAPGEIVLIRTEKSARSHVYNFIEDVALPGVKRASDAAHGSKAPYFIHEGGIDTDRYTIKNCFDEIWQLGSALVIVATHGDDFSRDVLRNVDRTYDLTGAFAEVAYDVIGLVCGVPSCTIPRASLYERATWRDLYSTLRPGSTPEQVRQRLFERAPQIDPPPSDSLTDTVADILADLAKSLPDAPPKLRLRDLSGYGPAYDWGMQLADDFKALAAGDIEFSDMDTGMLLSGPPGCGKTYFARALAEECGVELILMSYTEMETKTDRGNLIAKAIKTLFENARKKAPCIVFIDEIDSIQSRENKTTIPPGSPSS